MIKLGRRIWIGIGFLSLPTAAQAGAWTLPEGSGQAVIAAATSAANRIFGGAVGVTMPTPRYNKFELQGLVEYGWTDKLTLIANPSLQHIDIAAPTSAQRTGLGYFEFGGRYNVLQQDSWVLSAQATLRAPGTNDIGNPAAIGYTGVETDLRALLGYSFAVFDRPAFVDLELAQRFRSGAAPNEARADVTFGLSVAPRWLLLAQSFNVMSEGAGHPPFASYEYSKLQLSAVYAVTPWMSLQAGGFTTVAGRNALQENGVIFGLWYKF